MKAFFAREILRHPIVLWSAAAVVCIAAGSALYYSSGSRAPGTDAQDIALSPTSTITATGTVTPSQNPDLALLSGGRVAVVNVTVGQTVARGALLVSLDTAALSAARAQAAANVEAAQARLDQLKAGPRSVDVSAKQTAVSQANQALVNLYTQAGNDITAAYSNTLGAVHADSDSLFNNPDTQPTLVFNSNDSQSATNAQGQRSSINTSLITWQGEIAAQDGSPAAIEAELGASIAKLSASRQYADILTQALGGAITNGTFTATSVTNANSAIGALRASVSASLSQLQTDVAQLASAKLSVQSAQNALDQTLAGAATQDIAAQSAAVDAASANLDAANAALRNAAVIAPFAGSVAAVRVKVGDTVGPNTPAVSITPQSALQVEAYLSESDAPKVAVGDAANITLDAYGSGRIFAATVVGVDRSPTVQSGVPAYKLTLQFIQNDAAIAPGMTANVSLTPTH